MDMDEVVLARTIEAARAGGGHSSWDYHSRASFVHRYVAMTVPKVACTTIKMALQTWEGCGPEPDRWGDVHAGVVDFGVVAGHVRAGVAEEFWTTCWGTPELISRVP